jgi:hypothetical protein
MSTTVAGGTSPSFTTKLNFSTNGTFPASIAVGNRAGNGKAYHAVVNVLSTPWR